jgi:hypothetical protein
VVSANDWFSVQAALEALWTLGCPDARRYEGEPLAGEVALVGTPDIVAGPLRGGDSPADCYVDVVQPSGDHFVKAEARVASGDFREQLERSYLNKVDEKIAKYAGKRRSIMFGMVWAFSEIGEVPAHRRAAAQQAGLVLAGVVGLDQVPEPERAFGELQSMLAGGDDLLLRTAPLSLDLAFFLWTVKRERGMGAFLAINGRIGSEGHRDHPVDEWLRAWSMHAASNGRTAPPTPTWPR